jgi:hypothetical protein
MALWGAPVPSERHAVDACAAALECQRLLALQRAEADHCRGTPLHIRVGINTGRMLVGNIGSSERLSYTVIGDPVNVASRLEALGKIYGVTLLSAKRRAPPLAMRSLCAGSTGWPYTAASGASPSTSFSEWSRIPEPRSLNGSRLTRLVSQPMGTGAGQKRSGSSKRWPPVAAVSIAHRKSLLDVVAPASPIHRPTNGRRFRCGNRSDLRIPVLSEADILGALPALQNMHVS